MIKGKLGADELLLLTDPLDRWSNRLIGASSRVFKGIWKNKDGFFKIGAVKIMRPDQAQYALSLFHEETLILNLLSDVSGVIKAQALGFLESQQPIQLPSDLTQSDLRKLNGNLTLYYPSEYKEFLQELERRISLDSTNISKRGWISSWTPYLILQNRPYEENLLFLCDPAYSEGKFLDVKKGLQIIAQICDILGTAHQRNIVYRDHKLLHYYYSDSLSRVFMLDWNVAKLFPLGLSQSEINSDIIEFSTHSMHYILLGRPASSAQSFGRVTLNGIRQPIQRYSTEWIYDDRRLPNAIKDLINSSIRGEFGSVADLRAEVLKILNSLL